MTMRNIHVLVRTNQSRSSPARRGSAALLVDAATVEYSWGLVASAIEIEEVE